MSRPRSLVLGAWVATAVVLGAAPPAAADDGGRLFLVEVPGALPLAAPQRDWFGPGAMPALALYRAFSPYALTGLRLRGGLLLSGSAPPMGAIDPGAGGLGALTVNLRVRPLAGMDPYNGRAPGPWIEAGGGAGLTGKLFRAVVDLGLGWNFQVKRLSLGPVLRYLQVIQPADPLDSRDARIALLGVEVVLYDARLPRPTPPPIVSDPLPARTADTGPKDGDGDGIPDLEDACRTEAEDKDGYEDGDGCPDPDNDRDSVPDASDKCPTEAEVINGVDDNDGCPDQGLVQMIDDRIVLDERLLFDTERARVKTEARKLLTAVVNLWKQHPEWHQMIVEGHADARGPEKYNLWLSEERAGRVRTVLIELGIAPDKIVSKGFGRSRPRETSRSPEALQRNRRVELVIVRHKPAVQPQVAPPSLSPTP